MVHYGPSHLLVMITVYYRDELGAELGGELLGGKYQQSIMDTEVQNGDSTIMLSESESEPFLKGSESAEAPSRRWSFTSLDIRRRFRTLRSWWISSPPVVSHSIVFIITTLFWGFYFLLLPNLSFIPHFLQHSEGNSTIIPGADYFHCGDSIEAAKVRGCEYDILNNHWVPAMCIDEDAIREYQSDESWFGYADQNHTELLDIKTMGETPVYYTNERDHIVHCAMLWRKQFRALMDGRRYLDSIIVDEEHTIHCSKYLIEMSEWGPDFREMPIEVHVGYAGCHMKKELV
ncbi:hypothetical protein G7Y89_g9575 [Cudoniella acicularis]|uniref:Uncharacterized protein n=1 Tax=Cudoniella acicularis TaxID=354080 RepID=A0A8H4RFX6_9HELO|nr:hypothetical protein G7Y89_g9575 [Cudoniella acicularis]